MHRNAFCATIAPMAVPHPALVADWLVTFGGSESVFQSMHRAFPGPIHTLLANPRTLEQLGLADERLRESILARIPGARRRHRALFPLYPWAIEQFDLSNYDLVLSSSHAVAKSVLTHSEQLHVCYCHSPIRYVWDLTHEYMRSAGLDRGVKSLLLRWLLYRFRTWDATTAPRVDRWIANSRYIARRIRRVYGREAAVIYPPVDVDQFTPGAADRRGDYYVTVSRLVPYKRIDLIVAAFTAMPDRRLVVVGDGPEMERIKALAGPNVELAGFIPRSEVIDAMREARAFVFAANEDFGIVPVEAQACGTPVIALGQGGARETVVDGETGVFFPEQTPASLIAAVERFERLAAGGTGGTTGAGGTNGAGAALAPAGPFDPTVIRRHAESFSRERFESEYRAFVEAAWAQFAADREAIR